MDRQAFSDQGQLAFLGRLAAQGFLESAPKNTLRLRLSLSHLAAGTELRGGGPQPWGFWRGDSGSRQETTWSSPQVIFDGDVDGGTVEDDGDDEVEDWRSGQTSLCCSAQVTFVSSCKSLAAFQCFLWSRQVWMDKLFKPSSSSELQTLPGVQVWQALKLQTQLPFQQAIDY